jgi:hypothetical protein
MTDTPKPVQTIQVGDTVAYRMSGESLVLVNRGRVIALFNTVDGKSMAGVEWERLGHPKRVTVRSLRKV